MYRRRLDDHDELGERIDQVDVRNRSPDDFRAEFLEHRNAFGEPGTDIVGHEIVIVVIRHRDPQAPDVAGELRFVIRNAHRGSCRIVRVLARYDRQQSSAVARGAGERTNAVERKG
jgi:hypothetical protein